MPEEEVFPGLASGASSSTSEGASCEPQVRPQAPTDAPTEVLEDAPEAHRGIKKGNKQPPKDSTSSSCLAPTMPNEDDGPDFVWMRLFAGDEVDRKKNYV